MVIGDGQKMPAAIQPSFEFIKRMGLSMELMLEKQ
jgi:hypothetical protein